MRQLSYSEAIREAMVEEMRRDPAVFLIGEDVGTFGGRVRGVAQNEALRAGRVADYHRQRVADEVELWRALDLAQLKRDYGDRLTLIGNVDCATVLVDGPVEAVREQTEWVIRTAAPGGGFLLSTSNSVYPGVVPEYYLAMLDTARQVGDYPIFGQV